MSVELSSLTVKLDTTPIQTAKNRLDGMMKSATAAERAILGLETKTRGLYQTTDTLLGVLGRAGSGFRKYAEFATDAARGLKDMNTASDGTTRRLGSIASAADKAATAVARYKASLSGAGAPGIPGVGGAAGGGGGAGGGIGGAFRARFGGLANFGPFSGGMLTSLPTEAAGPVAAGVLGAAAMVATAKAAAELVEKTISVSMAFEKVKNTLGVGVGFDKVGEEMKYIRGLSDKLGLNFLSTAQGYAQMTAASKGTRLEGEATRKVFEGLSKAATAMQWSEQDMSLALLAVTQMISKGKISSEELRRQLGERMPGAMRMAADAMGITTKELEKQLKAGKLMTDDFLPKFAEQMEKKFGPAAEEAANSLRANFNRMETAVQTFFLALDQLGISEGFKSAMKGIVEAIKMATDGVEKFSKTLAGQSLNAAIQVLGSVVGNFAIDMMALVKSSNALGPAVDVMTYSLLGFSAILAGLPAYLKTVNEGLNAFSSFQMAVTKLATGDIAGASADLAVARKAWDNMKTGAEETGLAVDKVFSRFVKLRQEIQYQQELDKYGPFIKTKSTSKHDPEAPDEAKLSQVARYNQELERQIVLLSEGKTASRELRIEQMKGTEAEKATARANLAKLDFLEREALQAKEAKAEMEAQQREDERLAAEFMKAVDRKENGMRKLAQMQEIGNRLMKDGVISQEEYKAAMEGLTLMYSDAAKAADRYNKQVDAAAKRARNKHDETQGYREEIALVQEALRRGQISPEVAAERILELKRKVSPFLDELVKTFDNAGKQIGDAFTDAILTWQFTWSGFGDFMKKMATDIIKELARIVTYQMIIKPLLYGGAGGGGGFAGWLSGLFGNNGATGNSGTGGADWGNPGGGGAGDWGSAVGGAAGLAGPAGGAMPTMVQSTGKTEVNITVQSNGKHDTQVTSDLGTEIANDIKNQVDARITHHLRPGGAISKLVKGTI